LIEIEGGFGSEAAVNEDLFIVFEGPMVIIAVALLAIFHPGRAFAGRWKQTTLFTGKVERESESSENGEKLEVLDVTG
jgi:hypothetical protein